MMITMSIAGFPVARITTGDRASYHLSGDHYNHHQHRHDHHHHNYHCYHHQQKEESSTPGIASNPTAPFPAQLVQLFQ